MSAAHSLTGLHAGVVGAGNSAGQAVLHLARYCKRMHLAVRGPDLSQNMSAYLVDAIARHAGHHGAYEHQGERMQRR